MSNQVGGTVDNYIGVTKQRAAQIIGISIERLDRWTTYELVSPRKIGPDGHRTYTTFGLEDLVQGRIVRHIEDKGVSLRRIKQAVINAICAEHPRPLTSMEWGHDAGRIYVRLHDEDWTDGLRPGQGVLTEMINIEQIREEARKAAVGRDPETVGQIVTVRGTKRGALVFAGTRIPVEAIRSYLAEGYSDGEILEDYPDLEPDDLESARRLAS
jgi:uncharacterized protein (DUF433 family)